ncbi:C6 finger domain protein [Colletotrichum truncatum]|uniref:C6 finger domain protein n=1 Tax=Colletotrichum truncatum TaxID=5467 RepID=A0ACC3YKJ0_COLTU|nr:C6 finger domain protein [Colletotrichum truncatum]KAF6798296.1 C6 finger domain protein [Colletotrichum truncatum]
MPSNCTKEVHNERRTSRRSRFGCRNCKLRKLKCDQGKPRCERCISFGLLCNFLANVPDLQPVGTDTWPLVAREHEVIKPPLTNAVWTSDGFTSFQLNSKCQDFVTRYLGRSLINPRDTQMAQVNRGLFELTFEYPCLMHASLAVAFTYDRYLNASQDCRPTVDECFHWSQGTALLNKRLREPIKVKDKDPIWGTAAALALLTFSSPNAGTPEQAWPLKPSSTSDLVWLRMINGKMALWHIMDPLRPDSLFHVMAPTYSHMQSPLPQKGINGIPVDLVAVCNLQDSSTAEENPYFHAAHAVSQIIALPDREVTTGHTQVFTRIIHGSFEDLLRARDPVALLLFYLWYRKASRIIWWIELRARVECSSICLYLQTYHKENHRIQSFLHVGGF